MKTQIATHSNILGIRKVFMKLFKILVKEVLIFLICIYLSGWINEYTLTTKLQYVFVICYFFVVFNFLDWIISKRTISTKVSYLSLVIVFLFIGLTIFNGKGLSYQKTSFTLIDTRDSQFNEYNSIWISDIFVDGKSINLSEFMLPEGWSYISEWDDIISEPGIHAPLTLSLPRGKVLQIRFVYYDEFLKTSYFIDGNQKVSSPQVFSDGKEGFIYQIQSNQYTRPFIMVVGKYILLLSLAYNILLELLKKLKK